MGEKERDGGARKRSAVIVRVRERVSERCEWLRACVALRCRVRSPERRVGLVRRRVHAHGVGGCPPRDLLGLRSRGLRATGAGGRARCARTNNRKRSAHCVRCVALHVPQQLRALLCAPHLGVYPEHGIELRIDLGVAARGLFRGRAAVALEQQPVGWHSGDHSRRLLRAHVDAVRETKVQPGIASRTRRQTSSAQRARNVPPQCARARARAPLSPNFFDLQSCWTVPTAPPNACR